MAADFSESPPTDAVSAPYDRFRDGIQRIRGYTLLEEGDSMYLAFEPWFVESGSPYSVPCLRITFRRQGEWIVLQDFIVDEAGDARTVDIGAARDALQAWMDSVSD